MRRASPWALLALLSSAAAPAWAAPACAVADLRESYFSAGWAQSSFEAPLRAPAAEEALPSDPSSPAAPGGPVVHPEHAQVTHMFLTRMGFQLFNSRHPGTDLPEYIGDYHDDKPSTHNHDNVVEGAYQEDDSYEQPFNEKFPSTRHFWNWHGGPYQGIYGFDSGLNRAYKYLTGGYGIEGRYDPAWSENRGELRGKQGEGAIYLYKHGQKGKAFWYLGHIAHLLEDLSVPAHTRLFPHVLPGMDGYESRLGDTHARWSDMPEGPLESYDQLWKIFLATAQAAEKYDCGSGEGPMRGKDGLTDLGARRRNGFTDDELDQEAAELMPMAVRRVAALFEFFYRQVQEP